MVVIERGTTGRGAKVSSARKRRFAALAVRGVNYDDILDDGDRHFGTEHTRPSKSTITKAKQNLLTTGDAAWGERRVRPGKSLTDCHKEAIISALGENSRKRTRGELQAALTAADPSGRRDFAISTVDDSAREVSRRRGSSGPTHADTALPLHCHQLGLTHKKVTSYDPRRCPLESASASHALSCYDVRCVPRTSATGGGRACSCGSCCCC